MTTKKKTASKKAASSKPATPSTPSTEQDAGAGDRWAPRIPERGPHNG